MGVVCLSGTKVIRTHRFKVGDWPTLVHRFGGGGWRPVAQETAEQEGRETNSCTDL